MKRQREKGQALVELAIILPVLLLLLMGIIEFGRIFNAYIVVTQAAREGARVGTVGSTDLQIQQAVETAAGITLDVDQLTITITPTEGARVRGASLQVEVDYPVQIYAPIIGSIIGNPLQVSGVTTMRLE